MKPGKVRALALAVIVNRDRIFVALGHDQHSGDTFYRPLGGGIKLGEPSSATVVREIREEIGAELTDLHYLGLLENIFTYNGRLGHEIVLLHRAAFADPAWYARDNVPSYDDGDLNFIALWKPLDDFRRGLAPLYPIGLLDLIDRTHDR